MANDETKRSSPTATPHPALRRLDRLVGTWEICGRTLGAEDDDIHGRVVIEWLPGGLYLQQRGEMEFDSFHVHSLEVVGYDPDSQVFAAYVFSNMDSGVGRYYWDVQGDVVTHWTAGSKYIGRFSEDGNTLSGGWRPDEGEAGLDNTAYDATMVRVIGE